ncbi:hypothetical protein [Actinomyces howellii]|uniref:DNA-directed RNA polymerase II n=1 Tax=Actinomyces howellii TaxID=52771 RepID=A0A3S5EGW1_9ACTO|nr:hypothetical protein [Actinomyces howellii]VEG25986.1 Uncharacterised protein [Actinomyces howellii]
MARREGLASRLLVVAVVLMVAAPGLIHPPAAAVVTTGESTTGTASTVSPSTVAVGGTLTFTLSGFPQGATVQILIDDGALVLEDGSAAGRGVLAVLEVGEDGTASGAVEIPEDVGKGVHWLRFSVTAGPDVPTSKVRTADYTNKSPYFTVGDVTVIGGGSTVAPPSSAATPTAQTTYGGTRLLPAVPDQDDPQSRAVEVRSQSFPFIGTGVMALAVLLCVLAAVVVFNRWRLDRHRSGTERLA